MGSKFRCRVSPTGVPGCEGQGGTGDGGTGPTGPEGPAGPPGPTTPDLEGEAETESNETEIVLSIDMGDNEGLRAGVVWLGWDAANNLVIHETTFVLKRTGGGAAAEIGVHDNGDIRDDSSQIPGAGSDYVPTATGVDLTVTGVIGTPISWIVQTWFSLYPI